jgi:hypothetical protein
MGLPDWLARCRRWLPVPTRGRGVELKQWVLLEGNRYAVTAVLLAITFFVILVFGSVWTVEMQRLLTETEAVQTLLNTILSGIILLVSIVVSINSIVLSHDIASLQRQEDRVSGIVEFREEVGRLAGTGERPTDPGSFLKLMADIIQDQTAALHRLSEQARQMEATLAEEELETEPVEIGTIVSAKAIRFRFVGLKTVIRSRSRTMENASAYPSAMPPEPKIPRLLASSFAR